VLDLKLWLKLIVLDDLKISKVKVMDNMNIKNIFLATLLVSPFVLEASNDKSEKIRLFSDAFNESNSENDSENNEERDVKKRKQLQVVLQNPEVLIAQQARKNNEKQAICTMPRDCWTNIAKYSPIKDKLSLRLVSTYFQSLFYQSVFNGDIEAPKIRLKKLTLPSFSLDESLVLQQKRHVADFMEKTRIKFLIVHRPQDFVPPVDKEAWFYIKKILLRETLVENLQLNIIFSLCPNLEALDLGECSRLKFGIFLDEYKALVNGVTKDHSDFKALSEFLSVNALNEPECSLEINKIFGKFPHFEKYFSVLGWDKVKHLKVLALSGTKILSQDLYSILTNCSELQLLNLDRCGSLLLGDLDWDSIVNVSGVEEITELLPECLCTSLTEEYVSILASLISKQIKTLKTIPREKRAEFMRGILRKHPAFCNYFIDLDWSALTELRVLDLGETFITGAGLQKILYSCPKLERLILRNCEGLNLKDLDWSKVGELTILNVRGATNITNKELEKIGRCCPKLNILVLSNPQSAPGVKEADFDWTTGVDWGLFKNLTELDLDGNKLVSNVSLKKIRERCPKLKSLRGLVCGTGFKLTFNTFDLSLLNGLTVLKLSCEGQEGEITSEGLRYILNNCSFKECIFSMGLFPRGKFNWSKLGQSLEKLKLHCTTIKHRALQRVLQGCVNLKILDLSASCNSKHTLENLDWSMLAGKLISLNLSNNPMSDAGLLPILNSCVNLKILSLEGCEGLEFKNFDWTKLSQLHSLSLKKSGISLEGLLSILESCPLVEYLHLGKNNNLGLKAVYEGGFEVFKELKTLLKSRLKQ